jgi:hypothetical protein
MNDLQAMLVNLSVLGAINLGMESLNAKQSFSVISVQARNT